MGLLSSIRNLLGSKDRETPASGTSFEGAEGVELARNVSNWSLGHRDVAAFGPNYFAGRDGSLGIRLRSNPFNDSAPRES